MDIIFTIILMICTGTLFSFWRRVDGSNNKWPLSNVLGWSIPSAICFLYLFLVGTTQPLTWLLGGMIGLATSYLLCSGYDDWNTPQGTIKKIGGFLAPVMLSGVMGNWFLMIFILSSCFLYVFGAPLLRSKYGNKVCEHTEGAFWGAIMPIFLFSSL